MRRWFAPLLAGAFALLPAAPASADVTGIVRGHVTAGGAPRAGVTVTATGEGTTASAVTDANGAFAFVRLAFGRYTLAAHAAGLDATATVDVASNSSSEVALVLGSARTIGTTTASARGVGSSPVSVTTLSSAQIQALPQNQSVDRLIETVPGIVRFSYDEPVAHGFHGVSYQIDGAPIPQTTSASFAEIFDARNIDSMEVLTGAFPAEFGGERSGALVNIVTKRDVDIPSGSATEVSPGFGSFGTLQLNLAQANRIGSSTDLFFDANTRQTSRGLDAPSVDALHDDAGLSDAFLRSITRLGPRDTLAVDLSNQYNTYQVPINTTQTAVDQIVNLPGQDDVQREYNAFAIVNYTHTSRDGTSYVQVIPYWRAQRIVYAGDLAADQQAVDDSDDDCSPNPAPCSLAGLAQDRRAQVAGITSDYAFTRGANAVKVGAGGSVENFTSQETIVQPGQDPFDDDVAQRGTTLSLYAQDNWTPNAILGVQAGLRYDRSTGFVDGNQIEPRIGVNVRLAPGTIAHVYYGRLYAAPALEDTRRDAVVVGGGTPDDALPVYDLKPQTESYYEAGLGHSFPNNLYSSVNVWQRNVWNVIDTTQLFPTPIFATYNNALGLAHGVELRVQQTARAASWFLSASYSQSVAGGISGGTFLFPPDAISDTSLQPEDHDQSLAVNDAYTWRFGPGTRWYGTLGSAYGTGYPVEFQNGNGRLPPHLTFDAAIGRAPLPGSIGFRISALNLTNDQYLIKVNNGFNTTQYAAGVGVLGELQLAF